jgi:predicted metal-dependent hydrolase
VTDFLQTGINFFNDGRYFEANEAWEDLWRKSQGPLRLFYQGLVQAAVGLHHLNRGNLNGARSQIGKSLEKLAQYPSAFCGIDNSKFIADLQSTLQHLTPAAISISRV